jgi:hypothetical protein
MAYYLSKENEDVLKSFLPILRTATQTISLDTNDAERLVYIIRSAYSVDKYSWLKTKFIFSVKSTTTVVCKIRLAIVSVIDGITDHSSRVDLLDVVNLLIQEKPAAIRFTNAFLTEVEYERLLAYGINANYTITKNERGLTVISNG